MSRSRREPQRGRPRFRAPHRGGARVVVAVGALGVLAAPAAHDVLASGESLSNPPSIVIAGGTTEQRRTVIDAVDRYRGAGLSLPDLRVQIHEGGKSDCGGFQGRFYPDGDVGVIDLCYSGEFLVLHELGHAWDRFNLDDRRRREFEALTGLEVWRSPTVVWHDRGAERAANVLAAGLLSTPLETARYHLTEFAEFEALTGITSPRLAEMGPPSTTVPSLDDEQRARLAAYTEWRHDQA